MAAARARLPTNCYNGILNLQRIYNNLDLTVSDYVLYAHFVPKLLIWNQLTPKNKHPLVFFDAYIINSVNKKDNSLREKYKRRCCVTYKLQNVADEIEEIKVLKIREMEQNVITLGGW